MKTFAHPTQPAKVLELDGKSLKIVFDFQALAIFQDMTEINLLARWTEEDFTPKTVACLLFSGLYRHQPDVDIEWCLASLNLSNWSDVLKVLGEALKASAPQKANPPKPVRKGR